jgi:hypothetical protein
MHGKINRQGAKGATLVKSKENEVIALCLDELGVLAA